METYWIMVLVLLPGWLSFAEICPGKTEWLSKIAEEGSTITLKCGGRIKNAESWYYIAHGDTVKTLLANRGSGGGAGGGRADGRGEGAGRAGEDAERRKRSGGMEKEGTAVRRGRGERLFILSEKVMNIDAKRYTPKEDGFTISNLSMAEGGEYFCKGKEDSLCFATRLFVQGKCKVLFNDGHDLVLPCEEEGQPRKGTEEEIEKKREGLKEMDHNKKTETMEKVEENKQEKTDTVEGRPAEWDKNLSNTINKLHQRPVAWYYLPHKSLHTMALKLATWKDGRLINVTERQGIRYNNSTLLVTRVENPGYYWCSEGDHRLRNCYNIMDQASRAHLHIRRESSTWGIECIEMGFPCYINYSPSYKGRDVHKLAYRPRGGNIEIEKSVDTTRFKFVRNLEMTVKSLDVVDSGWYWSRNAVHQLIVTVEPDVGLSLMDGKGLDTGIYEEMVTCELKRMNHPWPAISIYTKVLGQNKGSRHLGLSNDTVTLGHASHPLQNMKELKPEVSMQDFLKTNQNNSGPISKAIHLNFGEKLIESNNYTRSRNIDGTYHFVYQVALRLRTDHVTQVTCCAGSEIHGLTCQEKSSVPVKPELTIQVLPEPFNQTTNIICTIKRIYPALKSPENLTLEIAGTQVPGVLSGTSDGTYMYAASKRLQVDERYRGLHVVCSVTGWFGYIIEHSLIKNESVPPSVTVKKAVTTQNNLALVIPLSLACLLLLLCVGCKVVRWRTKRRGFITPWEDPKHARSEHASRRNRRHIITRPKGENLTGTNNYHPIKRKTWYQNLALSVESRLSVKSSISRDETTSVDLRESDIDIFGMAIPRKLSNDSRRNDKVDNVVKCCVRNEYVNGACAESFEIDAMEGKSDYLDMGGTNAYPKETLDVSGSVPMRMPKLEGMCNKSIPIHIHKSNSLEEDYYLDMTVTNRKQMASTGKDQVDYSNTNSSKEKRRLSRNHEYIDMTGTIKKQGSKTRLMDGPVMMKYPQKEEFEMSKLSNKCLDVNLGRPHDFNDHLDMTGHSIRSKSVGDNDHLDMTLRTRPHSYEVKSLPLKHRKRAEFDMSKLDDKCLDMYQDTEEHLDNRETSIDYLDMRCCKENGKLTRSHDHIHTRGDTKRHERTKQTQKSWKKKVPKKKEFDMTKLEHSCLGVKVKLHDCYMRRMSAGTAQTVENDYLDMTAQSIRSKSVGQSDYLDMTGRTRSSSYESKSLSSTYYKRAEFDMSKLDDKCLDVYQDTEEHLGNRATSNDYLDMRCYEENGKLTRSHGHIHTREVTKKPDRTKQTQKLWKKKVPKKKEFDMTKLEHSCLGVKVPLHDCCMRRMSAGTARTVDNDYLDMTAQSIRSKSVGQSDYLEMTGSHCYENKSMPLKHHKKAEFDMSKLDDKCLDIYGGEKECRNIEKSHTTRKYPNTHCTSSEKECIQHENSPDDNLKKISSAEKIGHKKTGHRRSKSRSIQEYVDMSDINSWKSAHKSEMKLHQDGSSGNDSEVLSTINLELSEQKRKNTDMSSSNDEYGEKFNSKSDRVNIYYPKSDYVNMSDGKSDYMNMSDSRSEYANISESTNDYVNKPGAENMSQHNTCLKEISIPDMDVPVNEAKNLDHQKSLEMSSSRIRKKSGHRRTKSRSSYDSVDMSHALNCYSKTDKSEDATPEKEDILKISEGKINNPDTIMPGDDSLGMTNVGAEYENMSDHLGTTSTAKEEYVDMADPKDNYEDVTKFNIPDMNPGRLDTFRTGEQGNRPKANKRESDYPEMSGSHLSEEEETNHVSLGKPSEKSGNSYESMERGDHLGGTMNEIKDQKKSPEAKLRSSAELEADDYIALWI